jgi:hypothetical protein
MLKEGSRKRSESVYGVFVISVKCEWISCTVANNKNSISIVYGKEDSML